MAEGMSNAVQIAVYTKLADSTELTALLATAVGGSSPAIYDNVTQPPDTGDDAYFPYVVIGDDTLMDWSTDTASGGEASVTIHTWSRSSGKSETKKIQAAIYNALHRQELTVPDYEFIGCDFDNETSILDIDMETFHGTSEFRVYIDEVGYGD